jgi:hypothetical protein
MPWHPQIPLQAAETIVFISGTMRSPSERATGGAYRDRTPALQSSANRTSSVRRSERATGGAYRDRTDDPLLAKQVLSQLS